MPIQEQAIVLALGFCSAVTLVFMQQPCHVISVDGILNENNQLQATGISKQVIRPIPLLHQSLHGAPDQGTSRQTHIGLYAYSNNSKDTLP